MSGMICHHITLYKSQKKSFSLSLIFQELLARKDINREKWYLFSRGHNFKRVDPAQKSFLHKMKQMEQLKM